MITLEKEIEYTLYQLMDLELKEEIEEMGRVFAKLLASVQAAHLINYKLDVVVDPAQCLPQTKVLLESLMDVKSRFKRRRKLLTHRDILKVWLRKNATFKSEFLPRMF